MRLNELIDYYDNLVKPRVRMDNFAEATYWVNQYDNLVGEFVKAGNELQKTTNDLLFLVDIEKVVTRDLYMELLDSNNELLRDQVHAQNSEIIRLQSRIRELEGQVFGGSVQ